MNQLPSVGTVVLRAHLEGVTSIGMVTMASPNAGLVAYQSSHFVKLLIVNITITIQIKHAESYLKVAARGCKEENLLKWEFLQRPLVLRIFCLQHSCISSVYSFHLKQEYIIQNINKSISLKALSRQKMSGNISDYQKNN